MAMERSPDGLRFPCERCLAADSSGEVFCTGRSAAKPFRRLAGKPLRKPRITAVSPLLPPHHLEAAQGVPHASAGGTSRAVLTAEVNSRMPHSHLWAAATKSEVPGLASCLCPRSGHLPHHKVRMTATWEAGIPWSSVGWGGLPVSSAEMAEAEHLPTCSESLSALWFCCNKSGAAINLEQLA